MYIRFVGDNVVSREFSVKLQVVEEGIRIFWVWVVVDIMCVYIQVVVKIVWEESSVGVSFEDFIFVVFEYVQ